MVCDVTGQDHDNATTKRITNTFLEVKKLANFELSDKADEHEDETQAGPSDTQSIGAGHIFQQPHVGKLGLSYNINLILPNTDDPKIFNAIFRSLKDNLL